MSCKNLLEFAPNPSNYQCSLCSYTGVVTSKYNFNNHNIYECPSCSFLFLYPQPTNADLKNIYNQSYFSNHNFHSGDNNYLFGYVDYLAERFSKQRQFKKIAQNCLNYLIHNRIPSKDGSYRLLEVGCGPGYFLEVAKQVGFVVKGIDFNSAIFSEYSIDKSLCIEINDYEKCSIEKDDVYDCIVMLDVIEHFHNPQKVLDKAFKSLVPGGLLVISTIDSGSIVSRLLGKRLEDLRRIREHLYFFNRKNINIFLRRMNFHIEKLESIGHTFRLDHLIDRIGLMFPDLRESTFGKLSSFKLFSKISFYLNPYTKMLIYAHKSSSQKLNKSEELIKKDLKVMESSDCYYRYLIGQIRELVSGKVILDMGSGLGMSTKLLIEMGAQYVVGVDKDNEQINLSKKRFKNSLDTKTSFTCLDIDKNINDLYEIIKTHNIDTVFSINFLEHILDDVHLIKGLYNALPKGGQLISIMPSSSRIYNRIDDLYNHYRRYDVSDIRYKFQPFALSHYYQLSFIKYLGWNIGGKVEFKGIDTPWNMYHSYFFKIDCMLDRLFNGRFPFSATLISVHVK